MEPSAVYGSTKATAITDKLLIVKNLPGMLLKNGVFLVRKTKTTKVCVARDSTNQAVWKTGTDALNTNNSRKKVKKSKIELTGPIITINLLM